MSNNFFYCKTLNNKKIIAPIDGVKFNGGEELLKNYLDSAYYNSPVYNHIDYNIIEFYYLLFDKDLNIREVRVLDLHKRPNDYDKIRQSINVVLIDALQNTEGQWMEKIPDKKWYVYIYRHTIR
jgi:hypothetical protein